MDAVVVTSDSARDLQRFFSSPSFSSFDRLIVVDNGSRDRSREIAHRAGAHVLQRSSRSGYGAAVNLGAAETRGEFFAVINPDVTITDSKSLSRLCEAFEDERVAIAAPGLLLPDGSIQDSARCVPTPLDLVMRRKLTRRLGVVETGGTVPWVTGACLLVRRRAFDEVGGFDARYPLYFEDVDICVRLGMAGWRVLYAPHVLFSHHHHAASRGSFFSRAAWLHARSALRFYRTNPRHILRRSTLPDISLEDGPAEGADGTESRNVGVLG